MANLQDSGYDKQVCSVYSKGGRTQADAIRTAAVLAVQNSVVLATLSDDIVTVASTSNDEPGVRDATTSVAITGSTSNSTRSQNKSGHSRSLPTADFFF